MLKKHTDGKTYYALGYYRYKEDADHKARMLRTKWSGHSPHVSIRVIEKRDGYVVYSTNMWANPLRQRATPFTGRRLPRRNPITYAMFTNYYGGIPTEKSALEYAERETDPEYKAMFLRLAAGLKKGVRYVSYINENGQLAYRRGNPGAAYHHLKAAEWLTVRSQYSSPEEKAYFSGGARAHRQSVSDSEQSGMPNPKTTHTKKKLSVSNPLAYGPTGFRPPKAWWDKMVHGLRKGYKPLPGMSKKGYEAAIARIAGGIFSRFDQATRMGIFRKYEARDEPKPRNPAHFKTYVVHLSDETVGLFKATSVPAVREQATRDFPERYGSDWRKRIRIVSIKLATPKDTNWVKYMGGHVP